MGSKWKKVKMALVSNLCVYVPKVDSDESPPHSDGFSDAALLSPAPAGWSFSGSATRPASPSLRLSKSFNRSSKVLFYCLFLFDFILQILTLEIWICLLYVSGI